MPMIFLNMVFFSALFMVAGLSASLEQSAVTRPLLLRMSYEQSKEAEPAHSSCSESWGDYFKNAWIWLLALWAIKVIAKKKSSQSSGLPIFSIKRDLEPKNRLHKDMSEEWPD